MHEHKLDNVVLEYVLHGIEPVETKRVFNSRICSSIVVLT